jgi:hypothetical protein
MKFLWEGDCFWGILTKAIGGIDATAEAALRIFSFNRIRPKRVAPHNNRDISSPSEGRLLTNQPHHITPRIRCQEIFGEGKILLISLK